MDTPKFKVGDKVRRKLDDQCYLWTFGDTICTVTAVEALYPNGYSVILDDLNFSWDDWRFELVAAAKPDIINQPSHYTAGKVEVIDYILQVCKDYPGEQAPLVGNVIKYLSRAPFKGSKDKDLEKAQWYLNKLVATL